MKGRKLIALVALMALAVIPLPAKADQAVTDYESVYVIQKSTGEVNKIVSVDWIRVQGAGSYAIVDPVVAGTSPQLLIGDASVARIDTGIEIKGRSNGIADVYYRQEVNKPLPFKLKLDIYNNGKRVKWEDLKQSTGTVDIKVKFENYYKDQGTYMPWLINMNLTLDGRSTKDLVAKNGRVLHSGSKYTVAIMMQCTGESSTAAISYFAFKPNQPNLSLSVIPTLMAFTVPDMSGLKQLSQGLDAVAQGVDGHISAIAQIANSMTSTFDLSALDSISALLDVYSQVLSSIYAQIDVSQANALRQVPQSIRALEVPLQQTASASRQLASLVDAYVQTASQALTLNQQLTAVLSKENIANRTAVDQLLTQQGLLLQAITNGATLPNGYVPALATVGSSLLQLSEISAQLAQAIENTASNLSSLDALATGLVSIKDTIGLLINGGPLQGEQIPPMSQVSGKLRAHSLAISKQLNSGLTAIQSSLYALVRGGTVNGQRVPPMSDLSQTLRRMSKETRQAYNEFAAQESEIKKAKELADNYNTFSGMPVGAQGQVLFVIKIEDR